MKELPILEQSAQVQPSLGGGNFGAAAAQSAQADLQIANFGAEIAQNAATQRARLAGIEAGKNPRGDVGVFTKTDEAYVQAYKQEALSTLDFKGKQVINDMYADIAQNPTSEALTTFKNSSLQTIEELVANAPKEIQGDLHRSLEGTAMNNFYSLFGAFNQKEMKNYADVVMHGVSQGSNEIYDRAVIGDEKGANEINSMVLDRLKAAVDKGAINPSAITAYKDTAKSILQNAKAEYEMNNAKSPEAYLAEMQNKKWLAELPATERNNVIANTVNRFNQQQAALGAQQGINYIEYQTKIATGQMTQGDWIQAESRVDGGQLAQLKYKQATMAAEGATENRLMAQAMQHSTDGAFLNAQYSDKQKEAIHNGLTKIRAAEVGLNPDDMPFKERVMGSLGMHMPSPRLNKEADSTFRYGNFNQIREVADSIDGAKLAGNPELFSDLSDESKVMSKLVNQVGLIEDAAEANKKLKEIREGIYNTSPEQKIEGKQQVNSFYKKHDYTNPNVKNRHILSGLKSELGRDFFGSAKLPSEVSAMYDNLMNAYTPMTNDPNIADELSMDVIKKTFTRTHINGRDEYMPLSPEKLLPASQIQIENNKKLAVARLVKFNEQLRKDGAGYLDKIEWKDMPTSGNPFNNEHWGKKGDVILSINGKDQKLIVKTDLMTQKGVEQGAPSWAFYTQDADKPNAPELPLYFSNVPGVMQARWFPIMKEEQAMTNPEIKMILKGMSEKKKEIDIKKKNEKKSIDVPAILTLGGAL